MRFKMVRATAFGSLQGQMLDLAPGFTVIYGLNEAGKSTWHAAMYAALCGVRRGSGQPAPAAAFRAKYFPWTGGAWEVSSTIELDAGGEVHLHFDLDGKVNCQAVDGMGRDISSKLMFEGMPDGATLLGLNRNLYPQVGCIRQAEMLGLLVEPHGLQVALQKAVASPGASATVATALKNLDGFKAANVGLPRSNSTKPLAVAVRTLEATQTHLRAAVEEHDKYNLLVTDAATLRADAHKAETDRDQLDAHVLLAEARDLAGKLARMRELLLLHPDGAPATAADQDDLAARVAKGLSDWESRPPAIALTGETAADLQQQLDDLPPSPTGDTAPHSSVTHAEQEWRSAKGGLDGHFPSPPTPSSTSGSAPDAVELRKWADDLDLSVPPIPQAIEDAVALARQRIVKASALGLRRRLLIGAGAVLALSGGAALAVGFLPGLGVLLFGVVLAVAGAMSRTATPPRLVQELAQAEARLASWQLDVGRVAEAKERATRAAEERGLQPTGTALLAAALVIDDSLRQRETLAVWEAKRQTLERTLAALGSSLQGALRGRGATLSSGAESSFEAYKTACAERNQQLTLASGRPTLEKLLLARRDAEKVADNNQQEAVVAGDSLLQTAGGLSLANETEESAAASLQAWQQKRKARQAVDAIARSEWQELELLRADDSATARQQKIDDRRSKAAKLNPSGIGPAIPSGSNPVVLLAAARKVATDTGSDATGAEGRCSQFASTIPSVSEAEEALESAKSELLEVRELESVLDRTVAFLHSAQEQVQRNIAPVLKELVEPRLARVTGGRYARITVDPATLEVSVVDSAGAPRAASSLSHGTTEQVYLLLRVALAEHFGKSGESAPFLMDDVTVQSDSVRTKAILEVLHDLSTSHQIVLFTQEDDVLEWAKVNLRGPDDEWKILV